MSDKKGSMKSSKERVVKKEDKKDIDKKKNDDKDKKKNNDKDKKKNDDKDKKKKKHDHHHHKSDNKSEASSTGGADSSSEKKNNATTKSLDINTQKSTNSVDKSVEDKRPTSLKTNYKTKNDENGESTQERPTSVAFKLDICAGCNKSIMGDVSHALNKKWHLYCFVCTSCQVPVSDEYYENDGKPYCRRDYNKLFGSTCAGCKKPLSGKKLKALDKEWHPQCFVCCKCNKDFPDMEYYDIDQHPYCETCYDEEEEKFLNNRS